MSHELRTAVILLVGSILGVLIASIIGLAYIDRGKPRTSLIDRVQLPTAKARHPNRRRR